MRIYQGLTGAEDNWPDALFDKFCPMLLQQVDGMGCQHRAGKCQIGIDIELTGFVLRIEFIIPALVFYRIHQTVLSDIDTPGVIAVFSN